MEAYFNLAEAIITQALLDYKKGLSAIPRLEKRIKKLLAEIENSISPDVELREEKLKKLKYELIKMQNEYDSAIKFFNSRWFDILVDALNLNPDIIRDKIKKENPTGKLPDKVLLT